LKGEKVTALCSPPFSSNLEQFQNHLSIWPYNI